MDLKKELKQFYGNAKKEIKQFYENIKQSPLTSLICLIVIVTALILLIELPHWQVSGINNVTEKVTLENQSRATLAQVLGGAAIGIGLYYTWRRINIAEEDLRVTQENLKVAQDNLKVTQDNLKVTQDNLEATQKVAQENLKIAQEGQITERFTRAVDQLGNPAIEIRLGGIYALERIANESEKDYWPIMEILTAYVRKNSSIEDPIVLQQDKVSLDIQAILTVIGRRNKPFTAKEPSFLHLSKTYLVGANLGQSNLNDARLGYANLTDAFLRLANLSQAVLYRTKLTDSRLKHTNLVNATLTEANLENTDLLEANFENAYLKGASLKGAKNLTVDQLLKVKTLYKAELDPWLEEELRSKGYSHLLDDEP
ncbi:hypothetical protein ASJ81_11970 [Methanosarcina spelaei]|uniref:Low-complexity protein n=1 Tax=Methanosarcina spelaei TaxID=1036679 RepID=A0A2A2HNC1_9EURY|nr:pentapeptide repeat-containing protein [Methanosarcina spelaei]PAV10989.1 hypothetical protein ASJ81_11970 [Methanosarcina spelaei]